MLDLGKRFSFGIDLDDPWRYSGIPPPRSIIIPHLLSLSLPEGKFLDEANVRDIRANGETEPKTLAGRAILALTENLVEAKIDFVRCWFPWKYFEAVPVPESSLDLLLDRSYSQWPLDDLVNTLTSRGVGVVPVLACGYQRMLPQGLEPDPKRSVYLKRASIHTRLLVRHYKDTIRCWQIENEPNWWPEHEIAGWRSGPSWLHERGFRKALLGALTEAVHLEDPKAATIVNLEADAKVLAPGPYTRLCDVLGLDFYPNYRSSHPINTKVLRLADEVARAFSKPVIISETGYPSGPSFLGYSTGHQAEYVSSVCRDVYALEAVNGVGIWRYVDTRWRSFPPQENHFGLLDNKGSPKLAWLAYSKVIKELK